MSDPKGLEETARRAIDVAEAFADEAPARHSPPRPTVPAPREAQLDDVDAMLPLDAVPVLATPQDEIPWSELSELASRLVLGVDGKACTMKIVTAAHAPPTDGARVLARLVRRGILRVLVPGAPAGGDDEGPELEVRVLSITRDR